MSEMISIAAYKLQAPIEAPFRAVAQWIRAARTKKALQELSNSQLSDIGIERSEIGQIAFRNFR